jgi:hypothetical protein
LFATLDGLLAQKISHSDAAIAAKLAESIIKTADLEIRWAITKTKLGEIPSGADIGPILLSEGNSR